MQSAAWLLAVWLGLALCPLIAGAQKTTELTVGAAVADITPDLASRRTPMAGYSARLGRPAQGVHDPIHCKALVVSDGLESAAIVSCDLVSVSAALREKVVSKLADTAYRDHNLLLAATHSHAGPGGYDQNPVFQAALFGRYNDSFTNNMAGKIAAALNTAHASKRPAAMRIATAELPGLVRNRRYGKDYSALTRRSDKAAASEGLIDPVLTVVRFDNEDGEPMAVLFHFAAHATVLGPENRLISAEWPGVAMARIERAIPGTTAIFLNGAEGDQTPLVPDDGADDWTWMKKIGEKVGDAVLSVLDSAQPVQGAPVAAAITRREVQGPGRILGLPLSRRTARSLFPAMPLQAIRLGELVLMALPLEMTAGPGLVLKTSARSASTPHPLVVGLANDFYWYCAGPDEFKNGSSYEPGSTIFGRIEAGLVIGEELLLIDRIHRSDPLKMKAWRE